MASICLRATPDSRSELVSKQVLSFPCANHHRWVVAGDEFVKQPALTNDMMCFHLDFFEHGSCFPSMRCALQISLKPMISRHTGKSILGPTFGTMLYD